MTSRPRAAPQFLSRGVQKFQGLGGRGDPTILTKSLDLYGYHKCHRTTLGSRVGHGLDASMDWIGLDWIGLDWIGSNVGKTWMDWTGLDCGEWMM